MKPHPRIRKTIKWGGAVVTVLLVVVWIGSGWWNAVRWSGLRGVRVGDRVVSFSWWAAGSREPPPTSHGWIVFTDRGSIPWWFNPGGLSRLVTVAEIPLWPAPLMSLLITAFFWHRDAVDRARSLRGVCPKCNYDRTGLAAGAVCPECGAAR